MRRPRISLVINALAACVAIAIAVVGTGNHDGTAFALVDASGALSLSNSREGAAILSAGGVRPGASASGTVTIGNRGGTPAALTLETAVASEAAGTGGGRLVEQLRITIADGATVLYDGTAASLGRLPVGTLATAGERTYTFTATLPADTGNAYQDAQLALRFTWSAIAPEPAAAPPGPTPAPPTPAPPTPTVTPPSSVPAADPNTTVTADQIVPLPAASCLRNRLTVSMKTPRGVRVKRVRLTVNARHAKATGKKITVSLAGLRAPYKVKVSARLATGRVVKSSRTYRVCGDGKRSVRAKVKPKSARR